MAYDAKTAGDIIYRERTARRMSQKELAELVGCSSQTIGNYEEGKYKPDLGTAWALADVFELSLDALVGRETERAGESD